MSVTRDTSGDDMATALAAYSRTPEAATSDARYRLWCELPEIIAAIEDLLRIAKLHGKSQRLPWREREMTDAAQRRAIVALAHLGDIQKSAQADSASGCVSGQ